MIHKLCILGIHVERLFALGRLHHTESQTLVPWYIEAHPSLTEPEKEYTLADAKCEVQ